MKIGAMIVTYNRIEKLKKTLQCFDNQVVPPEYLLVVDNASTDGTHEFLQEWKQDERNFVKIVLTNPENLGGSGGFYTGMKYCIGQEADWIWISDDDAFPENDAIKKSYEALNECEGTKVAAICGTVFNGDIIDTDHRRKIAQGLFTIKQIPIPESEYNKSCFMIDELSYVGSILNKQALIEKGLTNTGYFICYDDTEHSVRLGEYGKLLCYPSIRIHHDVGKRPEVFSWKTYYAIRNKLHMYKHHFRYRYYFFYLIKQIIKNVARKILKTDKRKTKLYDTAIKDAKAGNLGKNDLYLPQWKL